MTGQDRPLFLAGMPPAASFGLLMVAIVCLSGQVLNDGDTFTHIAAGEWMLSHGAVLRSDPFSATYAGRPWVAHEWLAEILLALAYRGAGLAGVVVLTAAAAGTALGGLARDVSRWCGWRGTMLLTTAAVLCTLSGLLARPHILALPLMEVWAAGLLIARDRRLAPGWWLLGVMVIWANLHGGFAFGIALAGAFAVEATLLGERDEARRWWIFVAGAVGAALLTPQGWDGLLFPLRLLRFESLGVIQEWQPVIFSTAIGFDWVLLGLVSLLATGRVRVPWFRAALLVVLLYVALDHWRHVMLFGFVGALLLAKPVGRAFADASPSPSRAWSAACWSGMALVMLVRLALPLSAARSAAAPVAALARLPAALVRGPVLNSSQFGGYLTLMGLHPFIDGRAELFGDDFIGDYVAMGSGEGTILARAVERYGFEWAILTADDPRVSRFDRLAGWRRQSDDRVAVVFVRAAAAPITRTVSSELTRPSADSGM